MAAPRAHARPALLSERTFLLLDELRRFRHVVRNNYALDLGNEGVEQNLEMVREVLPRFEADLRDFEATLERMHASWRELCSRRGGTIPGRPGR
jgi:hypothetical protein